MNAFVQPETLEGSNQYFCEKCDKKCDAHKVRLIVIDYIKENICSFLYSSPYIFYIDILD